MAAINGTDGGNVLGGGIVSDTIKGRREDDTLTGGGGQDTFVIRLGDGTNTITDFGGVGTGVRPTEAEIAEVDVLQFEGAGLSPRNLLLTQQDNDLLISFEGVEDTQVVLQDFVLEELDNLQRSTGAAVDLGNILFNRQSEIEDSFDVFNTDQDRFNVSNPNTVTFLNDRDNATQGRNGSNDVINAQGGDDVLRGLSGNDLLRGGAGNDTLIGDDPTFSQLNLADLNGSIGFVLYGIDEYDLSGSSVSSAGDVNGDGFDDLLIGSAGADPNGQSGAGESYVVFGSGEGFDSSLDLANLDGSNGFVLNGIDEYGSSGRSISSAGDVNGDGFDDMLIGAPNANRSGQYGEYYSAGESYVVFGSGESFDASLDLANLDGSNGFVINAANERDRSGYSVSSAGDVNGDGFDDLLIGVPDADPNGQDSVGESYVVFGSGEGFDVSLDLADLDGSNGFVINGIDAGDRSGRSVSGAGDVNGDGFDDLLIGADGADPNGQDFAGESYVVFGSDFLDSFKVEEIDTLVGGAGRDTFLLGNGTEVFYDEDDLTTAGTAAFALISDFNTSEDVIQLNGQPSNYRLGSSPSGLPVGTAIFLDNLGEESDELIAIVQGSLDLSLDSDDFSFTLAELNLAQLNGSNGFVLNGINERDYSGRSVSSAGDVNGDGFDDLLIGASGADPNGQDSVGESYVVFGSGESVDASLDLAELNGSNGFVINGFNASDDSGRSVSSAGDVNGDGFDDLIIGAPNADPNGQYSVGESYVVFGSGADFDASLDLAELDGSNGFVLNGIDESDDSGTSVSSAGDVNGDGFDDLIVGAPYADPNGQEYAGESYVVFGKQEGFGASLDLAELDGSNGFVINAVNERDNLGSSVSSAGDVNGDGFDDLIVGAPYAEPNGQTFAGESYVIFGRDFTGQAAVNVGLADRSSTFMTDSLLLA